MTASFDRMATTTLATLRTPAITISGIVGPPAAYLSGISALPFDPVDADIAAGLGLDRPHELLQTMVINGIDIQRGDVITTSGYGRLQVERVSEWYWAPIESADYLHVIMKESVL